MCVTENAGGIRKPRFNAWTITITTTRRRRFHSMRTDEASRTRSAARLFLGVVRTRHTRPHPHPARPHEDGIRTPIPLVYSRSHTQCQRTAVSSLRARMPAASIHHACFARAALTTRAPPLADGVVSAQLARRRSSSSRVCLHAVEEPPPVALWRALCRAPTCPDVERPLITLIGPSQWSHLDRSRRSPYTLA